jgi:hypothetical protein
MTTLPLRVEDRLVGANNFLCCKSRVTLTLKEYDLWELVDKLVTPPKNPAALDAHKKKEIKVESILLDLVKDHLTPHLHEKKMTKDMFDTLVSLFQRKKKNKKMVLRNKLISM